MSALNDKVAKAIAAHLGVSPKESPIDVTPVPNATDVSALAPRKAFAPIDVAVSGMTTDVMSALFMNTN